MSTVKDAKTMSPGKLLQKRNRWRNQECSGCRSNTYNWPEWSGNPQDRTACAHKLPDDHICFSLESAQRARAETGDRRKRIRVATCNTRHRLRRRH